MIQTWIFRLSRSAILLASLLYIISDNRVGGCFPKTFKVTEVPAPKIVAATEPPTAGESLIRS